MSILVKILTFFLCFFLLACVNNNSTQNEESITKKFISKKERKALNTYNTLKGGKISLLEDVTIIPRDIRDDKYFTYNVFLKEGEGYTLPNFNYYDSTKRLPENNWIVYGYDKLGITDTTKIYEYAKAKSDSILELYHEIQIPKIWNITLDNGTTFTEFTIKHDYVLIYCKDGLENIDNEHWQIFINERATIIDENWCYGSTKDISVP